MRPELLNGGAVVDGNVTETGWISSVVFRHQVEFHLIKYLPERSADSPVLVLYDKHMSHINLG
jgi:hypothetical protein